MSDEAAFCSINQEEFKRRFETALKEVRNDPDSTPPTNVRVLRKEEFVVPNGKESFMDWEMTTPNGDNMRHKSYSCRLEHEVHYTIFTDLMSWKNGEKVMSMRTVAHGRRGELRGNVRLDDVVMTTIHDEGMSRQERKAVPVRMDLPQDFGTEDFARMFAAMGSPD